MAAHTVRLGEFTDSKQIFSILDTINKQRGSSKLCDVTLRISDDQIYAHSNVLAAASPYFDRLFSDQDLPRMFSQKSPQIIEIHIDGPRDPSYITAVQRVVDFMYTSQIRLDFDILTQVLEIAKIMQMDKVIEFCDLFQQGYSSYTSGNGVRQPCRDMQIQTEKLDNLEQEVPLRNTRNDMEGLVLNKSGHDSMSKNIKPQYMQFPRMISNRPRKKRGRPRKVNVSVQPDGSTAQPLGSENKHLDNEEKENVEKIIENEIVEKDLCMVKDQSDRTMSEDTEENTSDSAIDTKSEMTGDGLNNVKNCAKAECIRVSKRGRLIKPRVFADGIVSTIKQEVLSNDENEDANQLDGGDYNKGLDDKSYDEEFTVNKQIVKTEVDKAEHYCAKCDYKTTKIREYNEHQKEHLHAEKTCSFCGWVCDNPLMSDQDFQEHLKNHSGPEPYFCNFCSARFKTRNKLLLHLPKHSKSKPFVCELCHAGFKWKHALKNHMIVHKSTKDYLCDICGFSTAHKTQLKAHHLIHSGNTFKCTEPGCDYQATKKTNLKFHMMTHTREKPHQCEVCGTSFSLVKNMKRHMLLHTNDRPFRCSNCSFSTTRFDKLKEHCFKQHNIGEKPAKKFRLSEYIRMQESEIEGTELANVEQDIIKASTDALDIGEDMETIELQVAAEENGSATTQIVNVTSSTGEPIPIAITQIGNEISYEIQQFPIQFVTQEVVTEH